LGVHISSYIQSCTATLESGIYVGQGINIGLEKCVEKNKNRPLNKPRKHENHP
jgi:hypothetical protein